MMNFDLVVMTALYWGRFLEEQRDADIATYTIKLGYSRKKTKKQEGSGHTFLKNSWNF